VLATPGSQTICSGSTTSIALSNPNAVGGTTYSWTIFASSNVTGAAIGSGNTIGQTLTSADGFNSGTVTYRVTPSANGCSGVFTDVTITVDPVPTLSINNTVFTVCDGGTPTISLTNPNGVTGVAYEWTVSATGVTGASNSAGPSAAGLINQALTLSTSNTAGSVVYTVWATAAGCKSSPVQTVTVNVNPIPNVLATPGSQTICSGSTTSIALSNPNAVGGTTYSWTVSSTNVTGSIAGSGSEISQVLSSTTGNTPGSVIYTITPSANGCNGISTTVTITVNPNPTLAVNNTIFTICDGQTPTITLTNPNSVGGVGYVWTQVSANVTGAINQAAPVAAGAINTALSLVTSNTPGSVVYSVQSVANGCYSAVQTVTVTVNPIPSANGTDFTICSSQNAVVSINASPQNVAGTVFSWIVIPTANVIGASNGNGSTTSQALSLTDYSVGSVIYRITPLANGCTGPTKDITVTVDPIAVVDAGSDYAVCQPSTILLTGSIGGAATSGTWQIVTGSGSISVSATSGTTVTATYTVAPADIATTAVFRLITNDPDGAALPCNPASDILNVAVNRAPTVSLPADYTVCEPSTISLTGTLGGSASTGLWSVVSGAGVLTATNVSGTTVTANYSVDPSDIANTVVFRLTSNDPDGLGPCTPVFSDIHIIINRAARVFAPANLALCKDTPGIALGGSIGGSTTITLWSGGLGSFSNVNDPNATYSFKNPNEINTTVVLTLTALDPDGGGPCTSVSTQTNLKINPLPSTNFVGITRPNYVQNDPPIQLNAFQIGGLFTISPSTSIIGVTTQTPFDQATLGNFNTSTQLVPGTPDLSSLTVGSNTITYTFTDANGCTNSTSQSITINPVTSVNFTIQSGFLNPSFIWEICANQFNAYATPNPSPSLVKLIGNPPASTGLSPGTNFIASHGINNSANVMSIVYVAPDYYIETNGLPPDSYDVTYHYVNSFGAPTFRTARVLVHAGPVAQISVANNCISSAIQFNDVSPSTPIDPIVFWKWDFNDGSAPVFAQNPSHNYSTPKIYKVVLQVSTSFGCSDTTSQKVRVGAVPVVKFDASAICNNDFTKFKDLTTNPNNVSRITKYTWDFGDGNIVVGDSATYGTSWNQGNVSVPGGSAGTFKDPWHNYATFGTYHPKLTVNTNDGCNNSYQRSVFILPYRTVIATSANAYTEDFEASDGGYQVESISLAKHPSDSSWVWSVPNGKNINGGTKSWWTGLYNFYKGTTYDSAESSVVNGPCFDLSSLTRPMIAMDYWVNTQNSNNDGAVLQYSIDGGLNWFNVGIPGQGINWYSSNLIVSNPGNQKTGYGPYGWSGSSQTQWKRASFNLDTLLRQKNDQVRIRIAFAGDASKYIQEAYNGFAFDNVYVGNKIRNVLVEQFTNENQAGSSKADAHFDTLMNREMRKRNGSTDFNSLQYHVRFPKPDVFDQGNSDDPAARALFYSVEKVPYSMLDGIKTNTLPSAPPTAVAGDYNNINAIEIDRRALRKPPLFITQIDTTSATPTNHTFNVKVHIVADTAITYPLYAQVALVESPVTITGVAYHNVVRQLLYAGDGVTSSVAMAKNNTQIFGKGDVEISTQIADPTKLFLVAFVQNFATKEVLQSAIMPVIKKVGTLVTGIEPSIAELEQILIYPNPANGKFSFKTSAGEYPSDCIWKIADQRGINVMTGNFNDAVNGVKAVDISSLTNGVYFIAIGAPDRNPVYKKLVVLNAN